VVKDVEGVKVIEDNLPSITLTSSTSLTTSALA